MQPTKFRRYLLIKVAESDRINPVKYTNLCGANLSLK